MEGVGDESQTLGDAPQCVPCPDVSFDGSLISTHGLSLSFATGVSLKLRIAAALAGKPGIADEGRL